ncbi:MAG: GNAT family N-acetyltransferase [Actinomycetota bacterium]|nr:GNAT family N-acetyltransferase [Actinomycetota bacterium]
MNVQIEVLDHRELSRVRAIDVSESVRRIYVCTQGALERIDACFEIRSWDDAAFQRMTARLQPKLAAGGALLGAFMRTELVGAAVLAGEFLCERANQLELAFLYVDRRHRGRGVGTNLLGALSELARTRGADELYISASDTEPAIDFYLRHGCILARYVVAAIRAENEPTDIALTLDLRAPGLTAG